MTVQWETVHADVESFACAFVLHAMPNVGSVTFDAHAWREAYPYASAPHADDVVHLVGESRPRLCSGARRRRRSGVTAVVQHGSNALSSLTPAMRAPPEPWSLRRAPRTAVVFDAPYMRLRPVYVASSTTDVLRVDALLEGHDAFAHFLHTFDEAVRAQVPMPYATRPFRGLLQTRGTRCGNGGERTLSLCIDASTQFTTPDGHPLPRDEAVRSIDTHWFRPRVRVLHWRVHRLFDEVQLTMRCDWLMVGSASDVRAMQPPRTCAQLRDRHVRFFARRLLDGVQWTPTAELCEAADAGCEVSAMALRMLDEAVAAAHTRPPQQQQPEDTTSMSTALAAAAPAAGDVHRDGAQHHGTDQYHDDDDDTALDLATSIVAVLREMDRNDDDDDGRNVDDDESRHYNDGGDDDGDDGDDAARSTWRPALVEADKHLVARDTESTCRVCLENRCNIAFVPCGHMCACAPCVHALERRQCPVCRGHIGSVLRIFPC